MDFWVGFEKRAGHWDTYARLAEQDAPAAKEYLEKNRDAAAKEIGQSRHESYMRVTQPKAESHTKPALAGTGVMGALGGGLGAYFGGKKGAMIGAGIGAVTGALAGRSGSKSAYKAHVDHWNNAQAYSKMSPTEKKKHLHEIGQKAVDEQLKYLKE